MSTSAQAKEGVGPAHESSVARGEQSPLLLVDVDGVLSLFRGWSPVAPHADKRADDCEQGIDGTFHSIEGIPHFLSSTAAAHLLALAELFELAWASGWEERADEHLPHLLGVPAGLPFLRFDRGAAGIRASAAHWKLVAIDAYAGARALAWIDDALDDECRAWATARRAPTLLVQTDPRRGLTAAEADVLRSWALALGAGSVRPRKHPSERPIRRTFTGTKTAL